MLVLPEHLMVPLIYIYTHLAHNPVSGPGAALQLADKVGTQRRAQHGINRWRGLPHAPEVPARA